MAKFNENCKFFSKYLNELCLKDTDFVNALSGCPKQSLFKKIIM